MVPGSPLNIFLYAAIIFVGHVDVTVLGVDGAVVVGVVGVALEVGALVVVDAPVGVDPVFVVLPPVVDRATLTPRASRSSTTWPTCTPPANRRIGSCPK